MSTHETEPVDITAHRPVWIDDVPTGWCECGKPWPCPTASQEQDDTDAMAAGNFV